MSVLFINARVIDPHAMIDQLGSVLIEDGQIKDVIYGDPPKLGQKVVDCQGKCLAPGLVDLGVKVCEPGERHKESYRSAGQAAAAGGITTMITRPGVNVHHMAALTKSRAGSEMTEIGFMMDAGAVAFSDCDHVVSNTKVFGRALRYAAQLGALVIAHPQDPTLSDGAAASSGKFASLKGLPSVSPLAERMGLERDITMVEMTSARYHADQITTAAALPVLQAARERGLDVTAGTSVHHLTLNEFDVADYRSFFKVKPPLRSEDDRLAIVEAIETGLIDIISSMHTPQDEESKRLPFEEAASGAVAMETLLPAALRLYHSNGLYLPRLIRAMSYNPAQRLGLATGSMAVGAPADLIVFDPDAPFVLDRNTLRSKSQNTPFDGARLQGKVLATYVAGQPVFGDL